MKSLEELRALKEKTKAEMNLRNEQNGLRVVVGMATCGIAAGARPVMNTFVEEIAKRQLNNVKVTMTGCIGLCKLEPIVEVIDPSGDKVTYVKMDAQKAARVVAEHLVNGKIVSEYTIKAEENS
ncbi:MAG: (2Fe-2S) ferredoxin domain-containing protein [Clostridia bacterium]|nr:(2Fe-2S) ferredoxin domain-containing protein [Clostridia bacterium]